MLWVCVAARQRCTRMTLFYGCLAPHSEVLLLSAEPRWVAPGEYGERAANTLTRYDLRQVLAGRSEVVRQPYYSQSAKGLMRL
jgi:hypothetical protein